VDFTLPLRPPFRADVLKEDLTSRVERVYSGQRTYIRKTYTPRPLFLWRTLGRPAKSRREHDNLRALERAGVPVTVPLAWDEVRVRGCVPRCSLWLADAGEVRNLKEWFGQRQALAARRATLAAFGRLLRRLHEAGFVSLTAYPRNVLAADGGRLLLCDQPYLVRRPGPVVGAGARVDLYDALLTPGRARSLSRSDKLRALRAYAGGSAAAAALWRALRGRSVTWQRFVKACIKIGCHLGLWSRRP
jgi:hypothetical protein